MFAEPVSEVLDFPTPFEQPMPPLPGAPDFRPYVGCKIVKARPMTMLAFDEVSIRHSGRPGVTNSDGYYVQYEDGYTSWCPKDIFERCYRLLSEGELNLLNA